MNDEDWYMISWYLLLSLFIISLPYNLFLGGHPPNTPIELAIATSTVVGALVVALIWLSIAWR